MWALVSSFFCFASSFTKPVLRKISGMKCSHWETSLFRKEKGETSHPDSWLQLGAPGPEWRGACFLKSASFSFHLWRRWANHLQIAGWVWGYQAIRYAAQNSSAFFKTWFLPLLIRANTQRTPSAGQALCQHWAVFCHTVCSLQLEAACILSSLIHKEMDAPGSQTLTCVKCQSQGSFPRCCLYCHCHRIQAARGAGLFKT